MIKSTSNINKNTPIIAVTAYERTLQLASIFDSTLSKPVTKETILKCIRQLGEPDQHFHTKPIPNKSLLPPKSSSPFSLK